MKTFYMLFAVTTLAGCVSQPSRVQDLRERTMVKAVKSCVNMTKIIHNIVRQDNVVSYTHLLTQSGSREMAAMDSNLFKIGKALKGVDIEVSESYMLQQCVEPTFKYMFNEPGVWQSINRMQIPE